MKHTENTQLFPDWKAISKLQKWKKADFDNLLERYVNHKKEVYQKIKSIKKEDRNFENTILAIEKSSDAFVSLLYQIGTFSKTHKDKNFIDLANSFQKTLSENMINIEYDKDIYLYIKDYIEGNYKKEKKYLDNKYGTGSVKLVEDSFKEYKRMGFDLIKVKQDKFKNNLKKLSKISIDFSQNITEHKDFILCNEEEIKGLPENFVNTLEKVNGKYKITLDYPSIGPFLQYAYSREKRKEISDKNYRKGGEKNLKILTEMVKIRDENAKLLGYKNHADFKTENRMAKSEKNVRDFVESMIKKLLPKYKKELDELNIFAKNNLSQYKNVKSIEYYDLSYVGNKLKESKYSYDSSKLKEYFELDHVLKQMFNIFGNLFNFSVREIEEKEKKEKSIVLSDKEVKLFELKDKNTKQIMSYLILDLFPRDGKYGHACSSEFINSEYRDSKRVVPINEIICNFQQPIKSTPSLLNLGEVETLFHEFGHALHYMLTDCVYGSQAGYNTAWDFVETPSQFLEEFLFEENNFKKLAVHYKTKKPLDVSTIKKIIAGKNFLIGYSFLRQNIQSLFDLDLHSNKIKSNNSSKYFNDLIKKYINFNLQKDSIFPAGFGHLNGYDAGYYSYMWALVYAQDFYSEFKKVMNDKNKLKEIGERYRKEILEVGGSRDEMESAKKFLKRNPNNKAFLQELGIK
ncbi:MAG: M3 family metallopeptidase [Candidatus Paceibacterota bacterium]